MRSSFFSTTARSAITSSASKASTSAAGVGAAPARSGKPRTTSTSASASRSAATASASSTVRFWASRAGGKSTNETSAYVTFFGRWMPASASTRASGTLIVPICGRRSPVCASRPVSAVKTVVLPAAGNPVRPTFTPPPPGRRRRGGARRSSWRRRCRPSASCPGPRRAARDGSPRSPRRARAP